MSKFKAGDIVKRKDVNHDGIWLNTCKYRDIDPCSPLTVTSYDSGSDTINFSEIGSWAGAYFDLMPTSVTSGVKYESEKPRVDLLIDGCPLAIEAISQVLTFGAKKYSDHNWQKVEGGEQRYKAAMMRHVLASAKGEKVDSETGLSHLAHAACCVLFMLELELKKDA